MHLETLRTPTANLPPISEVIFRYGVNPDEHFQMLPGYRNFQPIRSGEPLAANGSGPIHSSWNAQIFMPLYQAQGDDGFFIIRQVNAFWLKVSEIMRHLHVDRLITLLPGIHRHPTSPNQIIADRRIARWRVLEIFHLLGYRRIRSHGEQLLLTRRGFDLRGPEDS